MEKKSSREPIGEKNTLEVKEIHDHTVLRQCYRLRYEAFAHNWVNPPRNHPPFLTDHLDAFASILALYSEGELIATCRINFDHHHLAPDRSLYDLPRFEADPDLRIAIVSKLVIAKNHRGLAICNTFFKGIYRKIIERNANLLLLGCPPKLYPLYKRWGLRQYKESEDIPGYGPILPLCLRPFDLPCLVERRSPAAPVLEQHLQENENSIGPSL